MSSAEKREMAQRLRAEADQIHRRGILCGV